MVTNIRVCCHHLCSLRLINKQTEVARVHPSHAMQHLKYKRGTGEENIKRQEKNAQKGQSESGHAPATQSAVLWTAAMGKVVDALRGEENTNMRFVMVLQHKHTHT